MQIQNKLLSRKRLTLIRITIAFVLLPIIYCVVGIYLTEWNLSFGPAFEPNCKKIYTYIIVRNDGDSSQNLAGWSFGDPEGSYDFPEYWLEPGQSINLWSGFGVDDQENLYAGRSNPMWALDSETWQVRNNNPFSVESFIVWSNMTCDLAVP